MPKGKKNSQAVLNNGTQDTKRIGYARVSTEDQSLDSQLDKLNETGCCKIFTEKISGAKADRPELKKCLEHLRAGDTLVIAKLDRLARSLKHLLEIVTGLEAEGKNIKILDMNIDTSNAQGKLVFSIFGAIAEFERTLIAERTKAGLEAARARGRLGGRKLKMTPDKIESARKLLSDKSVSPAAVAKQLGISRATLYKHLPGGK